MIRQACLQILPRRIFWISTVSLSHTALKENFSKSLKVIKDGNRVHQFIATLLSGKKAIYSSTSISNHGNSLPPILCMDEAELNINLSIFKLRDMIREDKPEGALVDMVLKALHNRSDLSGEANQRLNSVLSKLDDFQFLNPKCPSSKVQLKDFITDVEFFIRSNVDKDALFRSISITKGALKMLECMLFECVEYDLQQLINIVHKVVYNKHKFSVDDTREFDVLIKGVVSPILTLLSQLEDESKHVINSRYSDSNKENDDIIMEEFFVEQINRCHLILDKVPIYHMSLQEKFQKHLKDTISCNNAYQISEILSQGKGSIAKSEAESELLIRQLKNIIDSEKPDYHLFNMIVKALSNRVENVYEEASQKVFSLSDIVNFDLLKPKYYSAEKYLVKALQRLDDVTWYGNKSVYADYSKRLNILISTLDQHTMYHTQHLLDTILQMHLSRLQFSEEERRQFGTLMVEAIAPISKLISRNSNLQKTKIRSSVLKQRSSLECFKDFIGTIPVTGETDLKFSDMGKVDQCIETLDKKIAEWCDLSAEINIDLTEKDCKSNDECYFIDDEEPDTDLDEAGASEMPKSHTWWTMCSQAVNKIKGTQLS